MLQSGLAGQHFLDELAGQPRYSVFDPDPGCRLFLYPLLTLVEHPKHEATVRRVSRRKAMQQQVEEREKENSDDRSRKR